MTRGVKDLSYCVVGIEDNQANRVVERNLPFVEAAAHAAQNRERGHNSYVVEEHRRKKNKSTFKRVGTISFCTTKDGKRTPLLQYNLERLAAAHVVEQIEKGLEEARALSPDGAEDMVVTYDVMQVLRRTFYPPKRGKASHPVLEPLVYTQKAEEGDAIMTPVICLEA